MRVRRRGSRRLHVRCGEGPGDILFYYSSFLFIRVRCAIGLTFTCFAQLSQVLVSDADGKLVDTVTDGGFFGERSLMGSEKRAMRAEIANPSLCAG